MEEQLVEPPRRRGWSMSVAMSDLQKVSDLTSWMVQRASGVQGQEARKASLHTHSHCPPQPEELARHPTFHAASCGVFFALEFKLLCTVYHVIALYRST